MKLLNYLLVAFLLFIMSFFLDLQAQSGPLKIIVRNTDRSTIPGAAVKLKGTEDSNITILMTDNEGQAIFNQVISELYSLNIKHLGYKPIDTFIKVTQSNRSFEFLLDIESFALGEVSIVGKKPLIRQEDDKMIIDPAPIASTASNTLEVLESTPGMYVDQEGGIFLTGASPAAIYINGREQKMSNQDISTILRSLPPHSVEKIEVIRTPSTKYDASSSGGIINIVLKKGAKIGRFGSVNFGVNQGIYGRQNGGFSFNNSNANRSSYLNINVSNYKNNEDLDTKRFLQLDTVLNQSAQIISKQVPVLMGYGLNFDFSPGISLSYDGRINYTDRNSASTNLNFEGTTELERLSESVNKSSSVSGFMSIQQDAGLLIKFDTSGSDLNTKFSFSYNRNVSEQDYSLEFLTPFKSGFSGDGSNLQKRYYYILESDLLYHLPFKFKLETGVKSVVQKFSSNSDYFLKINGNNVNDPVRTNSFNYLENINALYFQLSRELFAGLNIKSGIRIENTNMQGNQTLPVDTSFLINRTDLFPYVYLSRRIFKFMGAELFAYLIYRKTINRPGYQELNPYIRFVDQYLYETGNPSLGPQFTDNTEINISFNDMPVFAIGRNITRNIFSNVMYNDSNFENVLVRTYDNVGSNREFYLRGIIGIPPGSKYFFAFGAQYNFNEYDGIYEYQPWKFSNESWRFFTFHSLSLSKDTKLSLTGFMMTRGQWNFYEMKDFGQLNIGLTQTFFNKKLTITLNARDILKTMDTEFVYNQGTIKSSGNRKSDTRWVGLNIRYNFGIKKKDEKKSVPAFEEPEF